MKRIGWGILLVFAPIGALGHVSPAFNGAKDLQRHEVRAGAELPINSMASLVVGDPSNPGSPHSLSAWDAFRLGLRSLRKAGFRAITTDIWWGLVEAENGVFTWDYYDRMAKIIREEGMRWIPILSFHSLGGNIGDTHQIPLPSHVWDERQYSGNLKSEDLRFKSQQGNESWEYISFWVTENVLPKYRRFMHAFQNHYQADSGLIDEINISLGPSGELRFPSYNSHDIGSGYPSGGSLQAYSLKAVSAFQDFARAKYGTLEAVSAAWEFPLRSWQEIYPPYPQELESHFFPRDQHHSRYGRDFFDFYHGTLKQHAALLLGEAAREFNEPNSPFSGIPLGVKFPGIHWRAGSDRRAELSAGMIPVEPETWHDMNQGLGYGSLLDGFKAVGGLPGMPPVIVHFTALELADGHDGNPDSRAATLAIAVGSEAQRKGLHLRGENALGSTLSDSKAWKQMADALKTGGYKGLTLLRFEHLLNDPGVLAEAEALIASHRKNGNPSPLLDSCASLLEQYVP